MDQAWPDSAALMYEYVCLNQFDWWIAAEMTRVIETGSFHCKNVLLFRCLHQEVLIPNKMFPKCFL